MQGRSQKISHVDPFSSLFTVQLTVESSEAMIGYEAHESMKDPWKKPTKLCFYMLRCLSRQSLACLQEAINLVTLRSAHETLLQLFS